MKLIKVIVLFAFLGLFTGCATDTMFLIERNAEGQVERIHHKQRFARYIPAIGKSSVTDGSSEMDSSILPDLNLISIGGDE